MKELSIEEKAKAYDGLVERLKDLKFACRFSPLSDTIEEIFPELKESEDERIRKVLVDYFKRYKEQEECGIKTFFGIPTDNIITWLEKQCKEDMIPLDKVIKFLDDQLVNDKDKITGESFINFKNYGAFKETFISYFKRKMLEKQGEQKPATWSEEDDKILKSIIINIENLQFSEDMREKYHHILNTNKSYYQIKIDWLKSLKDRVQPQPKNKWSEEDEKKLLCVCAWIKDYPRIADFKDEMYTVANNYINWLKSLRPQKQWKPSEEQMKALDEARSLANNCGEESAFDLRTLHEQLKKLREE